VDKIPILSKKKLIAMMICFQVALGLLTFRIFYIINTGGEDLKLKAIEQQTRDRLISPNRGSILDRNMIPLATTETVASISVIHNQVKDKDEVARILSEELGLEYEYVLNKVEKQVALERIKTKVDKETAIKIRDLELSGVVIDEDIKRVYTYGSLASQVIGFVGKDNQGIIGIEAKYDQYLRGTAGKIVTETDVRGNEVRDGNETRIAPKDGENLVTTLDVVLQQYAEQTLGKIIDAKGAKRGSIIMMNPNNGEILAMANKPDFDLNEPFTINNEEYAQQWEYLTAEEQNEKLNQMWRNFSINDTYEPGSTFKIFTAVAGLEEGIITQDSMFTCTGSKLVGGRQIKCWKYPNSHGTISFVEGVFSSCNPVFMDIAEELGAEVFYKYLRAFGFYTKTGIDLPGEAVGILYNVEDVGPVELATMSFGQSLQITPLQLISAAATVVNGGYVITPHVGMKTVDNEGNVIQNFQHEKGEQIVSTETAEIMKYILEGVVHQGTGNKTYIAGYRVGGKTATSQKLPRGNGKYIASFLAFAPAENPEVITLILVDEPQGAYYGGLIVGPVMKELLENTMPHLGIEPVYKEDELPETLTAVVPDIRGKSVAEAKKILTEIGIQIELIGEGETVVDQFPMYGETINVGSKMLVFTNRVQ
jgi:stage V sporulation protein D (sporulation-specific penicillin-binding protein)